MGKIHCDSTAAAAQMILSHFVAGLNLSDGHIPSNE